jgi:hypothetical protein
MAGVPSTYNRALTYANLSFSLSQTISSDAAIPFSIEVAAAKTGTLTTRTDNDTGTLTMSGGHGITTGQRLDLYWSGGSRYGMTVGTVATNSVPIDGGAGDNLPVQDTAITAMVPTEQALAVVGDNVTVIAVSCPVGGTVVFADGSNVTLAAVELDSTVTSYVWTSADGGTNPLAGDTVAKVFISHPSSSAASTISGLVQYN